MTPPRRPNSRARGLPLEARNARTRKSQNQVELGARWMGLPRRVATCLKGGGVLLWGPPLGPEVLTLPGALSRPASPLSLPPSPLAPPPSPLSPLLLLCPHLHHLCRTPFPQAGVPQAVWGCCQFPGMEVERRQGAQCGPDLLFLQQQLEAGGGAPPPAAGVTCRCPAPPSCPYGAVALWVTRESVRRHAQEKASLGHRPSGLPDRERVSADSLPIFQNAPSNVLS